MSQPDSQNALSLLKKVPLVRGAQRSSAKRERKEWWCRGGKEEGKKQGRERGRKRRGREGRSQKGGRKEGRSKPRGHPPKKKKKKQTRGPLSSVLPPRQLYSMVWKRPGINFPKYTSTVSPTESFPQGYRGWPPETSTNIAFGSGSLYPLQRGLELNLEEGTCSKESSFLRHSDSAPGGSSCFLYVLLLYPLEFFWPLSRQALAIINNPLY